MSNQEKNKQEKKVLDSTNNSNVFKELEEAKKLLAKNEELVKQNQKIVDSIKQEKEALDAKFNEIKEIDLNAVAGTEISAKQALEEEAQRERILATVKEQFNELREKLGDNFSFTDGSGNLTDDGKTILSEIAQTNLGLSEKEAINLLGFFESSWGSPSEIFTQASIFLVEQDVKRNSVNYPFMDLVPHRLVQNGVYQVRYDDYLDAEYQKFGTGDVVIEDWNPDSNILAEEVYRANMPLNKGFRIYMVLLNDIYKYPALFISIMQDIQNNISRPIAKEYYRQTLRILANRSIALTGTATAYDPLAEITKQTADETWTVADIKQLIVRLQSYAKSLVAPSRKHMPTDWVPNGLTEPLEMQINRAVLNLIMPTDLSAYINVETVAQSFNKELLDNPFQVIEMPYDKTFEEYGKVTDMYTNLIDNTTDENLTFRFILLQTGALQIIKHYTGTRYQETPRLFNVIQHYERWGFAADKSKFIKYIDITMPNPNYVSTGSGSTNPKNKKGANK